MTRLKSDEILSEWLAVADRARQPHQAPRRATTRIRLPIGMAAVAAVVVIVAVVGSRVVAPAVGPGDSASASPSATVAQPSATTPPSSVPSAEASPTPGASPATFTTAGVASNWQGFTWSTLPAESPLLLADPGLRVIPWRGGYVACGTTGGAMAGFLWTSADGLTWRSVTDIVAQRIQAAVSPTGLVAIAGSLDNPLLLNTVWTSTDGLAWHNAGTASGIGSIDSIAGTSAGLVATGHTLVGTAKFATSQFSVAFSTDGLRWTPVTIASGLAWDYVGPAVQSGNGRFFLMGGYTGGTASDTRPLLASLTQPGRYGSGILGATMAGTGGLWWSDDGRTWTKSKFGGYYVTQIQFGRDGMLMWTSDRMIPGGGPDLESSIDGGKTWTKEPTFNPLGAAPTTNVGEGAGITSPDGVFGSNGTYLLAVKSNGKAWVSSDGKTWTSIAWDGPLSNSMLVLPRGVVVDGKYGAAK
jgi:hypothetical protein